jgi:hypothetical protein
MLNKFKEITKSMPSENSEIKILKEEVAQEISIFRFIKIKRII